MAAESTATGWFYLGNESTGGVQTGPVTWEQLYGLAASGVLRPDDQVWHSSLPVWVPAAQIEGLFAVAHTPLGPAAYQPAEAPREVRSRRPSWLLPVLLPLAALVVVGAVLGALWGTGVFDSESTSLAETPMQGPTELDVPYISQELVAYPEEGGRLDAEGVVLEVPAGAVDTETTLKVKFLQEPFHLGDAVPSGVETSEAINVGPMVDFGPEGAAFDKPVTLRLPYDERCVPEGFSEEDVVPIYWDGVTWKVLSGVVDKQSDTVSLELSEFDGIAVSTAILIGLTITNVILWVPRFDSESVNTDRITEGVAPQWITPKDPVVETWADLAHVKSNSGKKVPLSDHDAVAQLLTSAGLNNDRPFFCWPTQMPEWESDLKTEYEVSLRARFSDAKFTNWQKPADYLAKNNRRGDCTDVTNTVVSLLIRMGYSAKGVFGYVGADKAAHVWAEVVVEGKPYLVDENGQFSPLTAEQLTNAGLSYPEPGDPRGFMWDDKSQDPYDPNWWKAAAPAGGEVRPPTDAVVDGVITASGLYNEFDGNAEISGPYVKAHKTTTDFHGDFAVEYWLFVPFRDAGAPAEDPDQVVRYDDYVGCYVFTWEVGVGETAEEAEGGFIVSWDTAHTMQAALAGISKQIEDTVKSEGLTTGWPSLQAESATTSP